MKMAGILLSLTISCVLIALNILFTMNEKIKEFSSEALSNSLYSETLLPEGINSDYISSSTRIYNIETESESFIPIHQKIPEFLNPSEILNSPSDQSTIINLTVEVNQMSEVYFKINNPSNNFAYTQIFILKQKDLECLGFFENCNDEILFQDIFPYFLKNNRALISPQTEVVLGPLYFMPKTHGVFPTHLYIKTNDKVQKHITVIGSVTRSKYSLCSNSIVLGKGSPIVLKEKTRFFNVFVKNNEDTEDYIKGVYFAEYSCNNNFLRMVDCGESFILKPFSDFAINIEIFDDGVQYLHSYEIWIENGLGVQKFYLDLEIQRQNEEKKSYFWNFLVFVLFFMITL